MGNLNEALNRAALKMLQAKGMDATEIISFESNSYQDGYCDTCAYTVYVVDITYASKNKAWNNYRYEGTFSGLIEDLSYYDVD